MKNLKTLFIVAVIAIIGIMSCENGTTNNTESKPSPLVGTWENTGESNRGGTYTETFEFSDTTIKSTFQETNNPEPYIVNGTYQYYDSVIIFRMDNGLKYFTDYSISNNELTLTFSHNGNTVTYQKK